MARDYLQKPLVDARSCLDDYTDEVPDGVAHNIHSTHKISAGWFQRAIGAFNLACELGLVDDSYNKKFTDYLRNTKFFDRPTTRNDIEFVEGLLHEFIEELTADN